MLASEKLPKNKVGYAVVGCFKLFLQQQRTTTPTLTSHFIGKALNILHTKIGFIQKKLTFVSGTILHKIPKRIEASKFDPA